MKRELLVIALFAFTLGGAGSDASLRVGSEKPVVMAEKSPEGGSGGHGGGGNNEGGGNSSGDRSGGRNGK